MNYRAAPRLGPVGSRVHLHLGCHSGRGEARLDIVRNACSPTATGAVEEAVNTISNTQMKLAPAKVHSRIAFTYCKTEGGSVLEYDPQGKAAEETRELFYWVCRQIGLRVRRERVE